MLEKLIQLIQLKIKILQIQLQIKLFKQKKTIPNLPKSRFLIIHHGAGDWSFDKVNKSHTNKWGFISSLGYGIGYQYFIEYGGKVYQGRRDNEKGAHTVGNTPGYYNSNSIGICLQGNMEVERPTEWQIGALRELIERKRKEYEIPNKRIIGHREVSATLCPGKNLYKWLTKYYPS